MVFADQAGDLQRAAAAYTAACGEVLGSTKLPRLFQVTLGGWRARALPDCPTLKLDSRRTEPRILWQHIRNMGETIGGAKADDTLARYPTVYNHMKSVATVG